MKKILITLAFFSSFSFVALGVALAQGTTNTSTDTGVQTQDATTADLGVENPGLLPTNPFYFVKEWGRGIRMVMTFNRVSKAQYEENITNQKAAELKKVQELNPGNDEALERAIDNYNQSASNLKDRLNNLQQTSNNPRVDVLLDKLTQRALKHEDLMEQLKEKNPNLAKQFDIAKESISESLKTVVEKLDTPEKLKERVQNIIQAQTDGDNKEIKALNILNKIGENAVSPDVIMKITEIRNEQIKKLEVKFKEGEISTSDAVNLIKNLRQSDADKLRILSDLQNTTTNVELKFKLRVLAPQVFKETENSDEDSGENLQETAENMIERATELLNKVRARVSANTDLSAKTDSSLTDINGILDEATKAFVSGNYIAAFQAASRAYALEKNLIIRLSPTSNPAKVINKGDNKDNDGKRPKKVETSETRKQSPTSGGASSKFEATPQINISTDSIKVETDSGAVITISRIWDVVITDESFSPVELKVKKGDTVVWTNKGSNSSWPASAVHPTHDVYPEKGGCIGSTFDACKGLNSGETFKFVFNQVGSWKYHDHLNSAHTGVIIVE
ncbi:MAG: DUF5667 domain-containing protein [Patescibacteria group bacterium]